MGAIIGGYMNLVMNADNIDNFWQALGYFGVGAAAGALSAGVGMGVSSALAGGSFGAGFVGSSAAMAATSSFATGAAIGGGAGFSAGFVTGAGNTWIGGGSFGSGLTSGLQAGAIGGLAGGVIGGLAGGINATEHGGSFWSGKGAVYESLAVPQGSISVSEGMEYSNEYANEFSDEYFGEIKGLKNLYADGTVPEGYVLRGDRAFRVADGAELGGLTKYLGKRQSDVYLYKTIFSSKETLYLGMGHEYLHVSFNASGIGHNLHTNRAKHASIYKWQYQQAKLWNHEVATNLAGYNQFRQYYNSRYDYEKYGFFLLSVRPWH